MYDVESARHPRAIHYAKRGNIGIFEPQRKAMLLLLQNVVVSNGFLKRIDDPIGTLLAKKRLVCG